MTERSDKVIKSVIFPPEMQINGNGSLQILEVIVKTEFLNLFLPDDV